MPEDTKTQYETTVGLEIHAELATKTKMFCNSKNDPDEERPNVNVCPICMGHPGTLPVINKEAVKKVLMMGIAVGGKIADVTEFDRKNYFYPDIPKGYQISQYKYPLVSGGKLAGVELTRIHLEEDTARSSHDQGAFSLVDFNRAGVPLMELVTEPVIHSAEEASRFAKELELLLQYIGAGEANMEKGEMRVEANISVAKRGSKKFGTKVEVKNLNSFRAVEKAIAYETARHIEALEAGETITQETRGWDETKEVTFSQRKKEDSHDYRYFPDPDLPKLHIGEIPEFARDVLKAEMGELPWERRAHLVSEFGIKAEDAEIYVRSKEWGNYFKHIAGVLKNDLKLVALVSNYITSDLLGLVKNNPQRWADAPVSAGDMAALVSMIGAGQLSSRGAKNLLKLMFETGGAPDTLAAEHDLLQKSDAGALTAVIEKIISEQASVVADYKAGKQAALQFLIGQAMKATKGSANPDMLREIFVEKLSQ